MERILAYFGSYKFIFSVCIVAAALVCWLLLRHLIHRFTEKITAASALSGRRQTYLALALNSVRGLLALLALILVLQVHGVNVSSLIAGLGIIGAIVIARWAWTLMGVTAGVLLDQTDAHVAEEIRELVEKPGGATITDLHVWRVGPQARAAIVSVLGEATVNAESIRERLKTVHEVSHLTVEFRQT